MAAEYIPTVPVLNKTKALLVRNEDDHTLVTDQINPEFVALLKADVKYTVGVKTDGSCGAIIKINGIATLCKRQDITEQSRNYSRVSDPENGLLKVIAGKPCYITSMIRGTSKHERIEPLYIFQLTKEGKPELEGNHLIGFTPVLTNFAEDKYMATSFEENPEDPSNPYIFATHFDGTLNIRVAKTTMADILYNEEIKTVEIMCKKISNKYGYETDMCFVNPHGSIVIPDDQVPDFTYNGIKTWFETAEATYNRWADQEGFVIHFPTENIRFKIHRGHIGLNNTWKSADKKACGIKFIF